MKRWPRDEKAPEAAFRAGHLLALQGKWREAVVVFGKVAEDYPKSERAPEALLQVAEGLVQLDRKDDARAVLEQLLADHPKSRGGPEGQGAARRAAPRPGIAKKAPRPRRSSGLQAPRPRPAGPGSRPSCCSDHWPIRFSTVLLAILSSRTTAERWPRWRRSESRMASRSTSSMERPRR